MSATAYTRFVDPESYRENQDLGRGSAKAAKPAKVTENAPEQTATFAAFATFAGEQAENYSGAPPVEPWTDAHEERAAIIEHDGGAPRAWAEGLARLDPSRPPADVPPKRWAKFIDDCGRFLDDGWAVEAIASAARSTTRSDRRGHRLSHDP